MNYIARLKQIEAAWINQQITTAEYHQILNYGLRRLYEDEMRGPCSFGQEAK